VIAALRRLTRTLMLAVTVEIRNIGCTIVVDNFKAHITILVGVTGIDGDGFDFVGVAGDSHEMKALAGDDIVLGHVLLCRAFDAFSVGEFDFDCLFDVHGVYFFRKFGESATVLFVGSAVVWLSFLFVLHFFH